MGAILPLDLTAAVVNVLRLCAWLALLTVIFVPLERLFALHARRVFRKSLATDVAYYFLSSLLPKFLTILPFSALAWAMHRTMPGGFYTWAAAMPVWLRLAASMVVGEVGAYWGHRWSHEIPALWRFHAVHHSAEEVDWLVHTRGHPIDMFFTRLCTFAPLYLLGLAQPSGNQLDLVPYWVTILGTLWGFFIHANVNWRLGWLEWIISSPAFHHWHHTNDGPAVVNKNFAPMLPWIDRCFGTLYLPKQWPGKYGIDQRLPPGILGQLVDPVVRILN